MTNLLVRWGNGGILKNGGGGDPRNGEDDFKMGGG